ncbi:MAG: ferritin-like domain-containing protein [Polyangiaceae bacterium]
MARRASPQKLNLKLVGNGGFERVLQPLHRWIWSNAHRRGSKLLGFAATEADSGRDMARAAECTKDALLRRIYLRHSQDEAKHAKLFTTRARSIFAALAKDDPGSAFQGNWFTPGERGLDDLDVDKESDASLLAFLFLSERAGARRFVVYQDVLEADPETRDVFGLVIPDEAFHTNYSYTQLKRISPKHYGLHILWAKLGRAWKAYLRLAAAVASVMGAVVLTVQYFVVLPLFAFMAKRSGKKELPGWIESRAAGQASLRSQY